LSAHARRDFHELLPRLLRPGGMYSYFNGLAADNAFFHAVYCALVKGELGRLGLETEFVALPINVADASIWEGVRNRYWQLDTYFLPVCSLLES
jgi:protein arginine N-methyltransferase 2